MDLGNSYNDRSVDLIYRKKINRTNYGDEFTTYFIEPGDTIKIILSNGINYTTKDVERLRKACHHERHLPNYRIKFNPFDYVMEACYSYEHYDRFSYMGRDKTIFIGEMRGSLLYSGVFGFEDLRGL